MTDPEVPLDIDFTGDNLSLNERADVELICGGAFDDLRLAGSAEFYRAVAWAIIRRTRGLPTITEELIEAGALKVRFEAEV